MATKEGLANEILADPTFDVEQFVHNVNLHDNNNVMATLSGKAVCNHRANNDIYKNVLSSNG